MPYLSYQDYLIFLFFFPGFDFFVGSLKPLGQNIGASESPLPYLDPELNGRRLLVGANFASAGVGILNDTGIQFVTTSSKTSRYRNFRGLNYP